MKSYTQGPWNSRDTELISYGPETALVAIVRSEDTNIAQVMIHAPYIDDIQDENEGHANANLITAAPELLEALESLLICADHLAMASGLNYSCYASEFEKAKDAIKKAKGEL